MNKSLIPQKISNASVVWNYLNGVVNVYKPAGLTVGQVRRSIIGNLCRDLNQLEVRGPSEQIQIEAGGNNFSKFLVRRIPNLADHVLAVGPRYQISDVRSSIANNLGKLTSGVLLLGINLGTKTTTKIHNNRPIRVYHVTGCFGTSTESHFTDSRITSKATYSHIWPDKINGLLASMEAVHQKKMFDMIGIDIQSQAAYELASKGPIRPTNSASNKIKVPILYSIKCIHFERPHFTLEIHAIDEDENYLGVLVHEIGLGLHTVAHCSAIRCIRHGQFDVTNSLVRRQWTLQSIIENMEFSNKLLKQHPELLAQNNPALISGGQN